MESTVAGNAAERAVRTPYRFLPGDPMGQQGVCQRIRSRVHCRITLRALFAHYGGAFRLSLGPMLESREQAGSRVRRSGPSFPNGQPVFFFREQRGPGRARLPLAGGKEVGPARQGVEPGPRGLLFIDRGVHIPLQDRASVGLTFVYQDHVLGRRVQAQLVVRRASA